MLAHTAYLLTVLSTALLVGNEFSIATLVHPTLIQAGHRQHLPAIQALAGRLGRVMPFWMAGTFVAHLALLALTVQPGHSLALRLAAALWGAVIVFTILGPAPINGRVARWQLDALPPDWQEQRRRWDRMHAARVVAMVAALLLLVMAGVSPR